jgi:tetratricopeptide (TPR) repeat protein
VGKIGEVLRQVGAWEKQGSLIVAYDLLQAALQDHPGDPALMHRAVLLLARGGASGEAERQYHAFGLDRVTDHEDIVALGGRLLKDRALAAQGAQRHSLLQEAIVKYRQAFALNQASYPAINIAMLQALNGEDEAARELAAWVLARLAGSEDYFERATRAEALMILGREEEADRALAEAVAAGGGDLASLASTLRQLENLGAALRRDIGWLDRHRPAPALHYCGHMFAEAGGPQVAELAAALRGEIARQRPAAMFGALAAGCDLLAAEAALAQGVALHVVLPFAEEEFLRCSVAPFGAEWLARYHSCRRHAASFRI